MTIFSDSYQTTIGSNFVTKPIITNIKESLIRNPEVITLGVSSNGSIKPLFITGYLESEDEIPLFVNPILVTSLKNETYLATDMRMFIRKDTEISNIQNGIKNITEYNFTKSRAILNLLWVNNQVDAIRNTLQFASTVYSAWISEVIAKTYALDYKDQTLIAIVSNFFYQTLFTNETVFNEEIKTKLVAHTMKATQAPAAMCYEAIEKVEKLENINDLCETIIKVVENIRLKQFNLPMLLTLIRNSWYGINSKEILTTAIEFPPSWIAIVYTALKERTYKNCMIYKIAERFGKRGASDSFMKAYESLIVGNITVESIEEPIEFKMYE